MEKQPKKQMVIATPYIEKREGAVRLCSKLSLPESELILFYEVDDDYGNYLCDDRCDAFLVVALEYAMFYNLDITCEAPVSSRLLYQLDTFYIPTVSKNVFYAHNIKITSKTTDVEIENARGVGTGFSGGVDSFYSVLKYLNTKDRYELTHLLIANVGALSFSDTELSKNIFEKYVEKYLNVIEDLALPLIKVHSNIQDLYRDCPRSNVKFATALKTCSCVIALQKLFHIYYFASGVQFGDFFLDPTALGSYDLLNLQCISLDKLTFYSSGAETTRIGKTKFIADNPIAQKNLSVCPIDTEKNCGRCSKCLRTVIQLYLTSNLEKFETSFDIEDFKKHKILRFAMFLANKSAKIHGYRKAVVDISKESGVKIPKSSYILAFFLKPLLYSKDMLKDSVRARKLFYKFNVDAKFYGKEAALKSRKQKQHENY